MKRFVAILLSSIVLTMLAASESYSQVCENCIPIPRADFELAKKAVDEAKESRILIQKQDREILLLRENGMLKDEVIKLLTENGKLKDERLAEKDIALAAEKTAREKTEEQLAIQTKETVKAKQSLKFWRKVGMVAGGALAFLVLKPI